MTQKILIVEDEPAIADTLVYALKTEGFDCVWVTQGQAALSKLEEQGIDLVLLDVGLPDMSGFDVCREIRKASSLPVLFLTSRTDEIDQVVGLELGADDYIVKPFSPRVLTARIRAHLRKTATTPITDMRFSIDPAALSISLCGKKLDLSRYEFRILQLLLEHPGRVYSRNQLMDLVWEEPDRSYDRTIDTHIKTIRQKIRQIDASLNPIHTHRGIGYSYEA